LAAASAAALTASPLPTAASFFTTAAIATIVSSTTFTSALTPATSVAGMPGAELASWNVGCAWVHDLGCTRVVSSCVL